MPKIVVVDARARGPLPGFGARIAAEIGGTPVLPSDERALREADIAIAMDGRSLSAARDENVPVLVAVLPALDARWRGGDLEDAHCVCVPLAGFEQALASDLHARTQAVGPLGREGFVAGDREALKQRHGVRGTSVLITADLLEELGANALLVQLGLTRDITCLFDVGVDVEAAEALRRLAPIHEVPGSMFAGTTDAAGYWQLADIVVAHARDEAVALALTVGAPLLLIDDARDVVAMKALEAVARTTTASTLSVDLESLASKLDEARANIAQLDAEGTAARIVEAARAAWGDRRKSRAVLPKGLPVGLEELPLEPVQESTRRERMRDPKNDDPKNDDSARDEPESAADLEAKIDAELEALKKRL